MSGLRAVNDIETTAQAWAAVQAGQPLIVNKAMPGAGHLKLNGVILLPGDAVTVEPNANIKRLIATGYLVTSDRAALGAEVLAEKRNRAAQFSDRAAADRAAQAGANARADLVAAELRLEAARLALRDAKEQHAAAQAGLDLASGGDPDRAARLHDMQRSVAHDRQRVIDFEAALVAAEAAYHAARAAAEAAQSL